MTTPLPRRLRQLFGAEFAELDEAALLLLISHSEGDDLEVKAQTYGRSDSNKRELCADVTALANGRGGLLLIGAAETSDVINALTPVKLDGEELWVRQVLASGVAPPVQVETRSIPCATDAGTGYVAIVVGASADAPHAVLTNDNFRYVVRDGPGKRSMREPEVADQHRRRVVAATTRLERLAEVRAAIEAHT
ncbi:MAG: ATP-binding protein, partial [Ilumatobacter sp.]|uniref:AlbA family DNA-binding domain-containing protein n=1 Tax=Ilumatobacter sp. TaxID=1967498 RepID=UPI003C766E9F